jgi:hypothetical protein
MISTDPAELKEGSERETMKPQRVPMEWMGPATWKLPSGKALAEFALQAGFLAPLLLGDGPFSRNSTRMAVKPVNGGTKGLTKVPR